MKRWYIVAFAFVFLLCAVCPGYAAVIDLSNSVDMTVSYAEASGGPIMLNGSEDTPGWVESNNGESGGVYSDPNSDSVPTADIEGWDSAAADSWAYNSSEWDTSLTSNTRTNKIVDLDVDLKWNTEYSIMSSIAELESFSSVSGFTYELDEGDSSTVVVGLDFSYYQIPDDFSIVVTAGGESIEFEEVDPTDGLVHKEEGSFSLGDLDSLDIKISITGTNPLLDNFPQLSSGGLEGAITFSYGEIIPVDDDANSGGEGNHDPVPEPSTMILLGCGLLGLARTRKKKHR